MSKTLFIILFFCCTVVDCLAQKNLPNIAGTVQIDSGTVMKQTEVTLQEWMGFIVNNNFDESLFPDKSAITPTTQLLFDDLRKQMGAEYIKIVNHVNPRSMMRQNYGEKGVEVGRNFSKLADTDTSYFSLKIPVTGITYEQVQRFCKWKEDVLNEFKKIKVKVSLPSIEIYKRVITNIDSLAISKKCYMLNCRTAKCKEEGKNKKDKASKMMSSQGFALEHVNSYFPTALGLYNLQGNAAEMTDTYGIAMGGSFRQTARESYNDRNQVYKKAEDWLGFRYIVTLK
jgi:formylglycine-generating enzyme required for sulfatase activity